MATESVSFIENVNKLVKNIDAIVETGSLFNSENMPLLEEIARLDLEEAIIDLAKGNFLGNRKIDIDLSLNKQGITPKMPTATAALIWADTATTVYYSGITATFVDGHIVEVPFVNDDALPIVISNHGTFVQQLLSNVAFTDYLVNTSIFDDIGGKTGTILRVSDVVGTSSNLERLQLHASTGSFIAPDPIYFWAKTTSAFQTLSMRASDIIKLGNDIDKIIVLASKINEVLEVQGNLEPLVLNADSLFNQIDKLKAIYAQITALVAVYDDIKVGGTNRINTVAESVYKGKVEIVAESVYKGKVETVASNSAKVVTVANDIAKVVINADNIANLNLVATEIVPNLAEILLADDSAAAALAYKNSAGLSATTASNAALIATNKSNEIKGITTQVSTLAAGQPSSVSYNPVDGKLTFGIPQGNKGDKGDNFNVNSIGLFTQRSLYDTRDVNFSFLAIDEAMIYFKLSSTSGNWSLGSPFGKGDTGPTGAAGNGIQSITKVSGNSGSGETDLYRITFTNANTFDFNVYNGLDSDISSADLTALNTALSNAISLKANTDDVNSALALKADIDDVNSALTSKADKLTTYTKTEVDNSLANLSVAQINKPVITSPTNGAIDFNGAVVATYTTATNFVGAQDYVSWEAATDSAFTAIVASYSGSGNLLSWTPSVGLALTVIYVRVKQGSDSHRSSWSDTISYTTPNIYINTPTLTVTGTPTDVPETPTLTTSAFSVYNGTDTHASTDWEVRKASDNSLVWSSYANTSNKLTINVPAGILLVSTAYVFKARHNGTTYGSSAYVSVSGTTKSAFTIPLGVAGVKGFSVAPTSDPFAVLGLAKLTNTDTVGHDDYGNYIHTNGSIVCWMPKGYYRIGNAAAAKYATYGANTVEIVGTETYTTEAAANAAGFVLPRAFIDGGVEKSGFFIDKYVNSKKVGDTNVAVSVKNGNPISLTTNATYTPSSTMTGCTGILADAITLCRARGSGWNTQSIFIGAWLMLTSVAHGQNATNATNCAWYDASLTTNFPKGCNNGSRQDVNDTSVSWTVSPDTAAKGLAGSASNFAKSTHNGSNNGVADVNGLMWQVALGMTNYGISATDTTQIATNTVYVLKTSVALKDLTAGWDGANDAFGNTTHLAVLYNAVTSPVTLATAGAVYWGNGTNPVFDSAASGVGRDLCGFLPKNDTAVNATGINLLGNDYIYKYNGANMFPLLSGLWTDAANAGVGYRHLGRYRSLEHANASFRAVAYV